MTEAAPGITSVTAPAAPAPWSPELANAAATLSPEAAAARIESLKADKEFYAALNRSDAAARSEWDELHRSLTRPPPPASPNVASEADAATQAQERAASARKECVAEWRRNGAMITAQQEEEYVNRRVIAQAEWDRHRDTLESYTRNRELGRKFVEKDPEHFTRRVLALMGMDMPVYERLPPSMRVMK
jgi:hypothetical protein